MFKITFSQKDIKALKNPNDKNVSEVAITYKDDFNKIYPRCFFIFYRK